MPYKDPKNSYEAVKRYRAKHQARYRAQVKKQNDKQRSAEDWNARCREYRQANPEQFRAYDKKRNAFGALTPARRASRRALKAKRRAAERVALCTCCTSKQFANFFAVAEMVGYHVDHIVPLADGGAHCIKNLQMLPADVHARKTSAENSRRARRL